MSDPDPLPLAPDSLPAIERTRQMLSRTAQLLFAEMIAEARATPRKRGEIEVGFQTEDGGRSVSLVFAGDGDPLPEEDLPWLFDPFYVRANFPEELGTNLMTCYLTVFHPGGTIRAKRTEDSRKAVVLTLPVTSPPPDVEVEEGRKATGRFWRLADFSQRDRRADAAALSS